MREPRLEKYTEKGRKTSNIETIIICFLSEFVFLIGIWLWNDYIATILTFLISGICLAILLISLIAELLERSNISRLYFQLMLLTMLTPIIVAVCYIWLMDGYILWLNQ